MQNNQEKKHVGMRLTAHARQLQVKLAEKLGIDKTAVVEMALRRLAEAENVS